MQTGGEARQEEEVVVGAQDLSHWRGGGSRGPGRRRRAALDAAAGRPSGGQARGGFGAGCGAGDAR